MTSCVLRRGRAVLLATALFKQKRTPGTRSLKRSKVAKKFIRDGQSRTMIANVPRSSYTSSGFKIRYTKSIQLFLGRLAMLGIAASIVAEVINGKGILAEYNFPVGLPINDIPVPVAALAGVSIAAAIFPAAGTYDSMELEALEQRQMDLELDDDMDYEVNRVGLSKENELVVGRVAQLGLAGILISEFLAGQGPVAQLGLKTGVPLQEADVGVLVLVALLVVAAVNEGYGRFIDEDE